MFSEVTHLNNRNAEAQSSWQISKNWFGSHAKQHSFSGFSKSLHKSWSLSLLTIQKP